MVQCRKKPCRPRGAFGKRSEPSRRTRTPVSRQRVWNAAKGRETREDLARRRAVSKRFIDGSVPPYCGRDIDGRAWAAACWAAN